MTRLSTKCLILQLWSLLLHNSAKLRSATLKHSPTVVDSSCVLLKWINAMAWGTEGRQDAVDNGFVSRSACSLGRALLASSSMESLSIGQVKVSSKRFSAGVASGPLALGSNGSRVMLVSGCARNASRHPYPSSRSSSGIEFLVAADNPSLAVLQHA